MASLFVYGDALMDAFALVDDLPGRGQDIISQSIRLIPGGSAANCAATAARLGINVRFIGMVAKDQLGTMVLDDLRNHGVDISLIKLVEGQTATVINMIDKTGEHTMVSCRGVSTSMPYGSIDPSLFTKGDILHVSGYAFQSQYSKDTAVELIHLALDAGASVSIDPSFNFAKTAIREYQDIISQLDFFFPNEDEALIMTQTARAEDALNCLRKLGIKTILLKMGAAGCYLANAGEIQFIDSYQIHGLADTTGAGDTFAGGFIAGRIKGLTPYESVKLGHACAATIVKEFGGHSAPLDFDILTKFAGEHQDSDLINAVQKMH